MFLRTLQAFLFPAILAVSLIMAPISLKASAEEIIGNAATLQNVLPAVVDIAIWRRERSNADSTAERRVQRFGSGFVIDPSGIIVTNRHVIEGATSMTVTFEDGSRSPAQLLAAAALVDLAVLKVNVPRKLPTLRFGDSDALRIGDPVLAVGNPLGVGTSVSSGIISALNRDIRDTPYDSFIQTDAAINHGNSGGPLIDRTGAVIGVNQALYSSSGNTGSIGLGFAIPANVAQLVITRLLDPAHVRPGWLGARVQDVTSDIASALHLGAVAGALVADVEPDSPAARGGIREGDVVLDIDGLPIKDARALMRAVSLVPNGRVVRLALWRNGRVQDVSVTIFGSPHDTMKTPSDALIRAAAEHAKAPDFGLDLSQPTKAEREKIGVDAKIEGVLVTAVEDGSAAANQGIREGSLITRVGTVAVANPARFRGAVAELRKQGQTAAMLLTLSKDGARRVALPLLPEP